jgi:AcrR family transcriptional regulator
MSRAVKPAATKNSRAARALATRQRICEAATRLFVDSGYAATTMDQVATEAGVAVQTVYFVFHTKAELLRAVFDTAVLGDPDAPNPDQQAWYQQVLDEPDARRSLELFVDVIGEIVARVGPLVPVFQSSGVAEVRTLFEDREQLRWEGYHEIAKALERRRALSVTANEAADVLYALAGPQLYALLHGRGWSDRKWRRWTTDTLQARLLR